MKTDEKQLSGKKDVQETSAWTRVWKFIREELVLEKQNGGWAHGAVTGVFSDMSGELIKQVKFSFPYYF